MNGWRDFLRSLAQSAGALATQLWRDYAQEAGTDAQAFAAGYQADIELWAKQTATGEITADDFADNVAAEVEIAELTALTKALAAQEQVQRFRDGLAQLVVDAALAALL